MCARPLWRCATASLGVLTSIAGLPCRPSVHNSTSDHLVLTSSSFHPSLELAPGRHPDRAQVQLATTAAARAA